MSDLQQERDFLADDIEKVVAHNLKDEAQAKALDERLSRIPGLPAGWLQQKRNMGELRCPYGGRFANTSVQLAMVKAATHDPSVAQLIQFLSHRAGVPVAAPNYEAQACAEQNARWEEEMRQWTEQTRANRQRAVADYSAMLQKGTPKTPAHIRFIGQG
jgi:hypothetical protein